MQEAGWMTTSSRNYAKTGKRCMVVGLIVGGEGHVNYEQANRVYSTDWLCQTLPTRYADDKATGFKILEWKKEE